MSTTRRHFLGAAAGASLAASLSAQSAGPNDRVRIALIGAGGRGSGDTRDSLNVGGVELAAVSDIYDGRLQRAREVWGDQIFTTRDYREVLARKDVDAVIIGTPDHWHSDDCDRRHECGQRCLLREADGAAAFRRRRL